MKSGLLLGYAFGASEMVQLGLTSLHSLEKLFYATEEPYWSGTTSVNSGIIS
jgi:hypothetical protein